MVALPLSGLRAATRAARYRLDFLRWSVGLWENVGCPHLVKRKVLLEHARRYGLHVFVETGTFMGDMLAAMIPYFDRLYSIELAVPLYRGAVDRFAAEPKVQLLRGDSGQLIATILAELSEPALFWLDAHYSGGVTARGTLDSPVIAELEAVLGHGLPHVVLVDDARMFDGNGGYPTRDELSRLVARVGPGHTVLIADDVIRVVPARA
jgi:hypothetical protein